MNDETQPTDSIDEADLAVPSLKPTDTVARMLHVSGMERILDLRRPSVLQTMLLIAIGAAIGANARYFLTQWAGQTFGTSFPYGTLIINISGSFLLGLIYTLLLRASLPITPALRLLFGVGILGGYTTFSSFSYETCQLILERNTGSSLLNPLLSVFGGIVTCLLGIALGEAVSSIW